MFLTLVYQDKEASSFRSQNAPLGPVSGSATDPFLETLADCSFCLDLKSDYLRQRWRRFGRMVPVNAPYGFTLPKMEENLALTGCEGCAVIQRAAREITTEYGLPFRHATLEFLDDEKLQGLSLKLSMLHPAHTSGDDWQRAQANPDLRIEIATGPSELSPEREWEHRIVSPRFELFSPCSAGADAPRGRWNSIQTRLPRFGDTASDPSVKWAMATLDHCRSHHSECNVEDSNLALPTRVLDLGDNSHPACSTADVKLYVKKGEREEYLCLSHCWGVDKKPIETTRETIERFQTGIPWGDLPKSFQDAVVFTRKLGVRFLWIDSLCIIQDDPADWAREAGEMASIYENALLTLAAASSANSQGGLFRTPKPGAYPTLSNGSSTEQPVVHMRQLVDPKFFDYRGSGGDDPDVSPLLKRAWVFQERILSRRVLFFTPLELVLECRVANRSESGHSWAGSETKHTFKTAYGRPAPRRQVARLWRRLVREFTHLQLTFAKDTIPAMAGIAKRIQRSQDANPRYAAGLWEDTFLEDMLWEVSPFRSSASEKDRVNHSLPSWSWARSDAPKRYIQSEHFTHLCAIEGVHHAPSPTPEEVFVDIHPGAHVIVSGFLLPAKSTKYGIVIQDNPRIFHIPRRDYLWAYGEDGEGIINDGDDLHILPLVVSEGEMNDDPKQDAEIHALVLRRRRQQRPKQSPGDDDDDDDDPSTYTYTRTAIFWTSMHHLLHHEYIFQGADVLLSVLQAQVAYGESILGEGGVYRRPPQAVEESEACDMDATGKNMLGPNRASSAFNQFYSGVQHRHLLLYGRDTYPELTMDEFCGLPHLEMLRTEMLVEEERVAEWRRRREQGEDQVRETVRIKIT
ncbi:HET domain protein [Lasiosphaeria hispida]|uniref:HET domain protein n=1 Tax=Lasiosphaeria hispida TaxID=260671 RepID=A0AAJ0MB93_9PEZI|nr:HET domain protein [Lasiosphaeria hispida]